MSWKQIDGYLQLLDIGSNYELWGVDDYQVNVLRFLKFFLICKS